MVPPIPTLPHSGMSQKRLDKVLGCQEKESNKEAQEEGPKELPWGCLEPYPKCLCLPLEGLACHPGHDGQCLPPSLSSGAFTSGFAWLVG